MQHRILLYLCVAILGTFQALLHAQAPYPDFVGAGQAADITVTASGFEIGSEPRKTVDGTGLAGTNHGNGYDAGWLSPRSSANPVPGRGNSFWPRYDLGHLYRLGASTIWNYNEASATASGLRSVTVDTSTDGNTWTALGTYEFARAPGTPAYPGAAGPDFGGVTARFVVLTATTNWGDREHWGLDELRIEVNREIIPPHLETIGFTGYMAQLMTRTASNARLSQLQHSDDLRSWYSLQNVSGAGVEQMLEQPMTGSLGFFRLGTMNNGGAIPTV